MIRKQKYRQKKKNTNVWEVLVKVSAPKMFVIFQKHIKKSRSFAKTLEMTTALAPNPVTDLPTTLTHHKLSTNKSFDLCDCRTVFMQN